MADSTVPAQVPLFPRRQGRPQAPAPGECFSRGKASLHFGRAEDFYAAWPAPICLISDGPYGVDGFPGDRRTAESLADWYEPHVRAWSTRSTPATTLWFWNTEIGWANVHPVLAEYGSFLSGREYYAAETVPEFYVAAAERLAAT